MEGFKPSMSILREPRADKDEEPTAVRVTQVNWCIGTNCSDSQLSPHTRSHIPLIPKQTALPMQDFYMLFSGENYF